MNGRVFVLAFAGLVLMAATAVRSWASPAEDEFAQAAHLTSIGAFEDSVAHWKKAEQLFEQAKDPSRQADTAIRLASAYYTLGQTRLALVTLGQAQDLVSPEDKKHLAEIKAALGGIYILAPPPMKDHAMHGQMAEEEDIAETTLKESIKLARAAKDARVEAIARINLGNLYSYRKEHDKAADGIQDGKRAGNGE